MADKPEVSPGQRIRFGTETAVVCYVYTDSTDGDCYIVYLEEGEAIGISVKWTGKSWDVAHQGDLGIHANTRSDLRPFVDILRRRLS